MSKKRPLGISILAVLVAIAAIISVYHTLQFLHILPFSLGPIRFFAFDLLGAIFWGLTALALIWVVNALWKLKPEGWMFVVVMAVFDLILVFMSILGQSTFQAMLPAILINVILLIYCFLPGVKAAFAPEELAPPAAVAPAIRATPALRTMEAPPAVRPMEAPPVAPAVEPPMRSAAVPLDIPAEEPTVPAPVEIVAEEPAAPQPVEVAAEEPAAPSAAAARPRPKVDIETIEGIGPTYAAKLKAIGILTVADILELGASRKGREELVEKTGVSSKLILKWVNMADLMRISGVGEEFSELLEAAGVDTVKELKMRNPDNLHQAMLQVNEQRKLVRRTPNLPEVRDWVEQAKVLEAVITY